MSHLKFRLLLIAAGCLIAMLALFSRNLIYAPSPPMTNRGLTEEKPAGSLMANSPLILHYHERCPYYFASASGVSGLCAEKAEQALRAAGIPFKWQETPPKRQLYLIEKNDGRECAVGWFKNPDREKFAKFTAPIYQDNPTIAIARVDNEKIESGRDLASILSNRQLKLLKKEGYSYGHSLDEKITRFQPREILTAASNTGMLKMIHSLRADYMFIAEEEAEELIRQSGFDPAAFKFIRFPDMPAGNLRYIICTKQVSDDEIERMDQAISQKASFGRERQ